MPAHFLWSVCLVLVVCIVYFRIEKQRDRIIKKDLRDMLEIERRQKEASLEFNSYFLNNSNTSVVYLPVNSKHYILHSDDEGEAVIEEKTIEFTMDERLFYGLNDQGTQH